jgi:hypothetical protein
VRRAPAGGPVPRPARAHDPANAFVTATGLYFLYGLMTFLWVQRDAALLPLPAVLTSS